MSFNTIMNWIGRIFGLLTLLLGAALVVKWLVVALWA